MDLFAWKAGRFVAIARTERRRVAQNRDILRHIHSIAWHKASISAHETNKKTRNGEQIVESGSKMVALRNLMVHSISRVVGNRRPNARSVSKVVGDRDPMPHAMSNVSLSLWFDDGILLRMSPNRWILVHSASIAVASAVTPVRFAGSDRWRASLGDLRSILAKHALARAARYVHRWGRACALPRAFGQASSRPRG